MNMERNTDRRMKNNRRRGFRRRRRAYQKKFLIMIITAVLLVFMGEHVWSAAGAVKQGVLPALGAESQGALWNTGALKNLYSPNAVLMDAETGDILEGYNAGRRIYPASLTKIMTAVLAAEHTENMEETITLPVDIFQGLYEENASMAGFAPGEQVRLKDLLYGILLPSGAECCIAFAERIAGSEEGFVELMNEKARQLGMEDTKFCNSTGLHEKEHYSTAEDMAVLLQYALKNETFRAAFTSQSYSTLPSEVYPEGFTFTSTMFRHLDGTEIENGAVLGGKTGYTPEAGLCLASLGEAAGREYILVTAGADGNHDTEPYHILDAVKVYGRIAVLFRSENDYIKGTAVSMR